MGGRGDGQIELDVISVTVDLDIMFLKDIAKWKLVKDKKGEDSTLRDIRIE